MAAPPRSAAMTATMPSRASPTKRETTSAASFGPIPTAAAAAPSRLGRRDRTSAATSSWTTLQRPDWALDFPRAPTSRLRSRPARRLRRLRRRPRPRRRRLRPVRRHPVRCRPRLRLPMRPPHGTRDRTMAVARASRAPLPYPPTTTDLLSAITTSIPTVTTTPRRPTAMAAQRTDTVLRSR